MYGLVFYTGDKYALKIPYPGSYEYLLSLARRRVIEDSCMAEIRNAEGHLAWVGYEENGQCKEEEFQV
jgi:hypothetical protein